MPTFLHRGWLKMKVGSKLTKGKARAHSTELTCGTQCHRMLSKMKFKEEDLTAISQELNIELAMSVPERQPPSE